jgi:NIMA-interacting peptidyl-prolyl cis-trans isomerase 1
MAHVALDHESISRRHAGLFWNETGELSLMDLGSSHGTFLNDKAIPENTPMTVRDGDKVRFAASSRVYRVSFSGGGGQKRAADDDAAAPAPKKAEREAPKEVRALHILIKHRESRRPSSWREDNITRSRDEAAARLSKLRKQILSGEIEFEEARRSASLFFSL